MVVIPKEATDLSPAQVDTLKLYARNDSQLYTIDQNGVRRAVGAGVDGAMGPQGPAGILGTATDTASIDLTLTGDNLAADVNISDVAGNSAQILSDGLFVAEDSGTFIRKDGDTETTAIIPFDEGLSVASVFEVTNNGTINSQAPVNVRTTFGDDLCLQLDHVGGEGYLISKNTTLDLNGLYFRFYGDLDLDFGTLVTDPKFNIKTKVKLPNIATGSVVSGGFVGLDSNNILVKSGIAYSDISGTPSLGIYQLTSEKNAISGYAGLDASGKINPSQLPALAITDTFVVASQSDMLALSTAEVGDVAVRTDVNKTFILKTTGYATLANWQELLTPTDSVSSVFGRSGAVTAQANDYTFAQIDSKPITLVGYGITDAQPLDSDLTTIAGLNTDGLLRRSSGTWGVDTNSYALASALGSYLPLTGGTLSGALSGTSASFSGVVESTQIGDSTPAFSASNGFFGASNADNTLNIEKRVLRMRRGDGSGVGISIFSIGDGANGLKGLKIQSSAQDLMAIYADSSITLFGALTGTSATFSGLVTASTVPSADTSLTNKLYVDQLVQKVTTTASTATLTVDSATTTQASLTAQAVALTIASPTGGVDGRKLIIRIKDNGTARGITWNAIFRAVGVTLPATTVVSKVLYVGAIYNSTETKWDVVSVAQQA